MSITALKIPTGVSLAQSIHELRSRVQATTSGEGADAAEPRGHQRGTTLVPPAAPAPGTSR